VKEAISNPTCRKVRNRGFRPVKYHTQNEVRFGWVVEETNKFIKVRLPGDDRSRKLPLSEKRFIQELPR